MNNLIRVADSVNYFFNPYCIGPFLVSVLSVVQGFSLNSTERKNHFNRCLSYFCLSTFFWLISMGFLLSSLYSLNTLFWARILFVAMTFMPATIYHLSVVLTEKYQEQKRMIKVIYFETFVVSLLCWNPFFIFFIRRNFYGFYPQAGILTYVTVLFIASTFFISLVNLVHYHFTVKERIKRRQVRLFMMLFLVLQLSFIDLFASYYASLYPIGYIVLFGFLLAMSLFKLRSVHDILFAKSKQFDEEMSVKAREVANVLSELRSTQFKLIESGKMSALASLSAGILHQISQPVTAIHGLSQFLKTEMDKNSVHYKAVVMMEEQSVQLKQKLEDLTRIIRHRKIKKEFFDINELIQKSMNLLVDELRFHRIKWEIQQARDIPSFYGDRIHLQQVFLNIIINAMKNLEVLSSNSWRYLSISSSYNSAAEEIIIIFQDTAESAGQQSNLGDFEPFFSVSESNNNIGLALCHDLLLEHGGDVEVINSKDEGTKYIIKLPCKTNMTS